MTLNVNGVRYQKLTYEAAKNIYDSPYTKKLRQDMSFGEFLRKYKVE